MLWAALQLTITETEIWTTDPARFGSLALGAFTFEPYQTLWFIYMLGVFYAVTRALRRLPKIVLLLGALALRVTFMPDAPEDVWVLDAFCDLYIFFLVGYVASPLIFGIAETAQRRPRLAILALGAWGVVNWLGTQAGLTELRGTGLVLGLLGAAAVVSTSALLSLVPIMSFIRFIGEHSIVVYLTSPLAMRVMEKPLLATNLHHWNLDVASIITTTFAVAAPLAIYQVVKKTPLSFLYVRPEWARITQRRRRGSDADAPLTDYSNNSQARGAK